MKIVLLMDLANVTVPLSLANQTLDPLGTIRNLRNMDGVERISGLWAFADYQQGYFTQALQRDLMAGGFQLIQAPRITGGGVDKATDDVELVNHADWLMENCTNFDTVFLVSGDRDFLRVSQRFLNRGLKVYLVNPNMLSASRDLRNAIGKEFEVDLIETTDIPQISARKVVTLTESPVVVPVPLASRLQEPDPTLTEHENHVRNAAWYLYRASDANALAVCIKDLLKTKYGDDPVVNAQLAALMMFYTVREIMRNQAAKKMPCTMNHLVNVLKGTDDEVEGFDESDYRRVINVMSSIKLLWAQKMQDGGKTFTSFSLSERHPFLTALTTAEEEVAKEPAAEVEGAVL
jgi:hypothetical protein